MQSDDLLRHASSSLVIATSSHVMAATLPVNRDVSKKLRRGASFTCRWPKLRGLRSLSLPDPAFIAQITPFLLPRCKRPCVDDSNGGADHEHLWQAKKAVGYEVSDLRGGSRRHLKPLEETGRNGDLPAIYMVDLC